MNHTDYDIPWNQNSDYIRELIRKNEVVKKRREKIKKLRVRKKIFI